MSLILLEVTLRVMIRFEFLDDRIPLASVIHTSNFPDGWQSVSSDQLFRPSPDPELEYELIPNSTRDHIRVNSLGFRGPEISQRPEEGVIRIAVIGDSETFGAHLAEADTFSVRIENRLEEIYPQSRFEVLNLGVPGYNTAQEYRLLQTKVLGLAPHIVLLRYSFNDPAIDAPQMLLGGGLFGRSYVYLSWRLLTRPITPLSAIWAENEGDWPQFFLDLHRSQYFDIVESLLISMASDLDDRGIPFILFTEPEISAGIHHNYPYDEIHHQLAAVSSGRFDLIESLGPLRQACTDSKELWYSDRDPHKNALANEIQGRCAADGLVPVLEQNSLAR